MDWNKLVVLGGQIVALVALAVLVGLGHDGAILDALIVLVGSVAGQGVIHSVSSVVSIKPAAPGSAPGSVAGPTLSK